jgi:DeoR/GlpR family transcriptional regulator of sugar metabolism
MKKKAFVEERRLKILDYVKSFNRANVSELAENMDVTEATIRRDLLLLENEGLIHRTHGGVIKKDSTALWQTSRIEDRMISFKDEKDRIAEFVSHLIGDNESIMIDDGSTTLSVAEQLLTKKNLLIVTNSSKIGTIFLKRKEYKIHITGGELMWGTNSMTGPTAESELRRIRTDKAIIGVSGISVEDGFFSANPQEGEIKRLMIENAKETIVVADCSKFDVRALFLFSGFERISKLITDKKIKKEALNVLKKNGVDVFVV